MRPASLFRSYLAAAVTVCPYVWGPFILTRGFGQQSLLSLYLAQTKGLQLQALAKALQLQDFDTVKEVEEMQTMLLAPPECHQHITGPVPVVRGGREPPPENVDRLNVLTDPGRILHSTCVCYS